MKGAGAVGHRDHVSLHHRLTAIRPCCLALATVLSAGCIAIQACAQGQPSIEITSVPPFGGWGSASGRAANVDFSQVRVALLIFIPDIGWWSKPTAVQPWTPVGPDGKWSGAVANGGVDDTATVIAAFLIPSTYDPPFVAQGAAVPPALQQNALASAYVQRPNPNQTRITFAGREWLVKSNRVLIGPGSNYFTESAENVWTDDKGKLHLRITHRDGRWYCAEVLSVEPLGYGRYTFRLASDAADLDPNVVFGMFTWSYDAAYTHREIDIEFSRWGEAKATENCQFVVQPHFAAGHRHRFAVTSGSVPSTHSFTWRPYRVDFASQRADGQAMERWRFADAAATPPSGDEQVHINLWLLGGQAPTDGQEVEVVLEDFTFEPWSMGTGAKALSGAFGPDLPKDYTYRLWGRVTEAAADSFRLADGYGLSITVTAPGHGLAPADFAVVRGKLNEETPPGVVALTEGITKL